MDLNQCCDRTPDLKHSDDFSEYYFECSSCNYESSNRENPKDAATKWNIEKPNEEHSISNYASKYPKEDFIQLAETWVSEDSLEDADVEFDNPVYAEKRGKSETVYIRCWIMVTEDEVTEAKKDADDES